MKGIIDRFEGEFAVVETDGGFVNVPKAKLPAEAKEGAVIDLDSFLVDNEIVEAAEPFLRSAVSLSKIIIYEYCFFVKSFL